MIASAGATTTEIDILSQVVAPEEPSLQRELARSVLEMKFNENAQMMIRALLDKNNLKWKSLATPGAPIPTPWPKEQFEKFSRDLQARRAKLRAERRPESEMSALFREERAFDSALFANAPHGKSIGAFQGANYDAQSFYRPAIDCIMFTRDNVPFCPVCSRTIENVIDAHTR